MKLFGQKKSFQPRARLLLQLGDKLIRNENIALLELIKNSYDADSKKVIVKLENIENSKIGVIDIIDDGEGMNMNVIENIWLEPGSDYKEELFKKNIRTKKYNRLPIGEKGIGRFGVHKLGYVIELISKRKGFNEVVVKIDWKKFAQNKYLKDAEFEVYENTDAEYFKGIRTGTRIRITDLRASWDKRMVRDLYKSVFSLQSPFNLNGDFNVDFQLSNPALLDGLPKWEKVKHFSLFHFKVTLKGANITNFTYEFTPWEELHNVEPRTINEKDEIIIDNETLKEKLPKEKLPKEKNETEKKNKFRIINLDKNYSDSESEIKTIGEVVFEGYIFDRDKTILEYYNHPGINLLKEYLDEQGGIRVYREFIRINEYGEAGNDWLNLDSRRVNEPTRKISNNIILGVVELKKETSTALEEKTNREGFVENEAFHDFKAAILHVLQIVEKLREFDKANIRAKYGQKEQAEPVIHHLGKLKELIDDIVINTDDNAVLTIQLEKIEEDYKQIQEILITSAGAGLTLSIGLHEIEKVVSEAKALIDTEKVPDRIKDLVNRLDTLMENYSIIIRQDEDEENDLKELIKISLINVESRFKRHKIFTVEKRYENYSDSSMALCLKRYIIGAIINILDNSIYWLEVKEEKLKKIRQTFIKKILIDIVNVNKDYVDIVIADNGIGFTIPTFQLTKPFITTKLHGMGLGLHIADLAVKSHDGKIIFPDHAEYDLPEDYNSGALVVIRLKKV